MICTQNVELLLKPLNLHPVLAKTMIDKFAAVGILQVFLLRLFIYLVGSVLEVCVDHG